jgi:quercetin dioxygenase-like cupin family protein
MTDIMREHLLTGQVQGQVDRVETHRVELAPGQAAGRHTHPGGVAGYVVSGRIAYQRGEGPAEELRAGSVFFEPPGEIILRFDNLSGTEPATFIAYYLVSGDQLLIELLDKE